jgi:phosphatidyl-myo-inositol dimannoside synthase
MSMRLLALVTDAYGVGGGIAQYNRDLFLALSQSTCVDEIVVLPRFGKADAVPLPRKVRQLAARPSRLGYALRAVRACRGQFDAIFCGHLYMVPLAVLLSRLTGAPVWLQIHGIEAWQRPSALLRWAAEQAALVTAVSRHTRRLFLGWAKCEPQWVKVLPNTVDECFKPGPKPAELLARYALRDRKVLLTVSRLAASERYKGHDRVIAAMAALRPTNPDLVYVVAGDGDDRPRLEALARDLGVTEAMRFIGYVPAEDLPDLYRIADVFVMPSTGEGFGIVFLQALASAIPVIGGSSDGSCDPLRDGKDGTLIPVHDDGAVAEAVKTFLRHTGQSGNYNNAFEQARFASLAVGMATRLRRAGV